MDQAQAIKRLRKALGPKMGYRIDPKALDADGREEAQGKARELLERKHVADEVMKARRAELLRDPAYQALRLEYEALDKEHQRVTAFAYRKRITVGIVSDLFFHVRAEGDNWDEVVSKAGGAK